MFEKVKYASASSTVYYVTTIAREKFPAQNFLRSLEFMIHSKSQA